LLEFVSGAPKVYRAEIALGATTETDDAEGAELTRADASAVTEDSVRELLSTMTGTLQMVPPMYAAIRHEGRKLYELAREGRVVERAPREVRVYRLELLSFRPGPQAAAIVDVECSQGTYIRSLARVIGERLGYGGHLRFLLRTGVGGYRVQDAATLEELQQATEDGTLARYLRDGSDAADALPAVTVDDETARRLALGMSQRMAGPADPGRARVMTADGRLLCIADIDPAETGFVIQPRKVFAWDA
jgi:tRNA pseudouridine55 synthase